MGGLPVISIGSGFSRKSNSESALAAQDVHGVSHGVSPPTLWTLAHALLVAMRYDYMREFLELGIRYKELRENRGMVQVDTIEYGFSLRHYQQLEAGRSHSVKTLFRLAEMFGVDAGELIGKPD